ncbi:MAG: hypothetical protein HIU86_14445 [Acidobacteria bacterium]|nr:hypothetical protein [Acidobacteriota bacterium]
MALAVLALSCVVLTGCSSPVTAPSGIIPSGVQPAVTTPPGVKPLLAGLVDKGSEASYHLDQPYPVIDLSDVAAHAGAFGGVVVNQTWAQLEPTRGGYDFSTLDASLAAVTAYNVAHPSAPIGVRLRVFAAFAAPAWAKSLDGAPIAVPANLPSRTGGTLGRWWKTGYRSAWASLQQALAARYDASPVLREVAVSSCTTLTAEPFVMAPAISALATADGWTTAAQQSCLDGALTDYRPWTHTAIYYPMNPMNGGMTVTDEVMQRCASSSASGGPLCILANNALSPLSATSARSAPVYARMDAIWSAAPTTTPIAFQMNGPNTATYCAALAVAVAHHAQSVEVWPSAGTQPGFTTVPTATLKGWDDAVRHGAAPAC